MLPRELHRICLPFVIRIVSSTCSCHFYTSSVGGFSLKFMAVAKIVNVAENVFFGTEKGVFKALMIYYLWDKMNFSHLSFIIQLTQDKGWHLVVYTNSENLKNMKKQLQESQLQTYWFSGFQRNSRFGEWRGRIKVALEI